MLAFQVYIRNQQSVLFFHTMGQKSCALLKNVSMQHNFPMYTLKHARSSLSSKCVLTQIFVFRRSICKVVVLLHPSIPQEAEKMRV